MNDVVLRGGPGAVAVHGLASTAVHAKTGAPLSHHSFLTPQRVSAETVSPVAPAGRGRWKGENDNHHVRKTKGDHVEHNCGHGKQSLAAFLLSRNLLAFLFHTVLAWCDDQYALLRQGLARRQTFCDALRALTRSRVFESWQHLLECMIRGRELEAKRAAKLEVKLDTG
jgi:hypothetical protein